MIKDKNTTNISDEIEIGQNQFQELEDPLQQELDKMKDEANHRLFLERTEIENILSDNSLIEQGCFRLDDRAFILNLFFRKIECNVDNI